MASNPQKALDLFCSNISGRVLNIGDVAKSPHNISIKEKAISTTISLEPCADIVADYNSHNFHESFDAIWCAHCLEHQRNVGVFLEKIFKDLKNDGLLCITVPPLKHNIVGGHLSLWNGGILLYNLILAGFDCSSAYLIRDGYNVSVLVRKKKAEIPNLNMDFGDIEKISNFFPFDAKHGFNGDIEEAGDKSWLSR